METSEILLVLAVLGVVNAAVAPVNEDDPELYKEWTTPNNPYFYRDFTPFATFVGNLLAGRSEFPYIVRISSTDLDSEKWGIGNLITLSHVLTSARQVEFIIDAFGPFDPNTNKKMDEGLLLSLEYITARIMYCANYLYEDYKFSNKHQYEGYEMFDNDVHESGTRYVRFMYKHPFYKREHLTYDVGIMKTNYPIRPMPPLQDYMPVWFDFEEGTITDIDLHLMDAQRRVCYIASFGSQWYNYLAPIEIANYKVKYRVYWTKLDECVTRLPYFKRTVEGTALRYDPTADKHLMCFRSRAKVGAVCDHDRGAPLVCDQRVYGFVSRAANWTYCNNRLPLPFLVIKSAALNGYYQELSKHAFLPFHHPKSEAGKNFVGCYLIIVLFLLSFLPSHLSDQINLNSFMLFSP